MSAFGGLSGRCVSWTSHPLKILNGPALLWFRCKNQRIMHRAGAASDLSPMFGFTALNVRPAPRRRCLARGAGWICAPPPRHRRSLVLGAGKFPQRQAERDERHGRRLNQTGADRAARDNTVVLVPSYRGRAPTRLREKPPCASRRRPHRALRRCGLEPIRKAQPACRRAAGAPLLESALLPALTPRGLIRPWSRSCRRDRLC